MATPPTLKAIEAECRKLGLTDIRYTPASGNFPGAEKADRPGDFNPHGITIHITAGGLGSRTEEQYIRDIINGDPSVPVKANAVVAPDGTLWLNAQGNANHCLYYGAKAMDAAINASFPLSGNANYRGSLTKWSLYAYGVEMIAASGAKVTPAQRKSAVIWAAAIARLHGWTGQETHGHGEVAYDRSWDDPGIDMGAFRRDVMATVKSPGANAGTSKPPTTKDWFDMATEADLEKVIKKYVGDVVPAPDNYKNKDKNPTWYLSNAITVIINNQDKDRATLAKQGALLEALMTKLLTPAEIQAAAEAGAKAAIDAKISDADVTLSVEA